MKTKKHKSKENYVRYRSAVDNAEKDKNGISIVGKFDFGFIDPEIAKAGKKVLASITATQPVCHSTLAKIQLASSFGSNAKQAA